LSRRIVRHDEGDRHVISRLRQMPIVFSALFLTLLMSFAGCAMNITRDELLRQMRADAPILIVDVRSQKEYDRDHIPGAVHIPFYSIGSGLSARGYSKSDPVVLYCEHGPRSGIAGFSLYLSGYEKVYSLEGAMKAWRKNEFPIEVITR
jgi:rhodanese-related sulfurtransferase